MKQCQKCGTYSSNDTVFCYFCESNFPDYTNVISNDHTKGSQETENICIEQKVIDSSYSRVVPLLQHIALFLKNGEFNRADEYCERVLDIDSKNAEAYIGKLLVESRCNSREQLKKCKSPIENSKYYGKILKFGNEEQKTFLINAAQNIRKNIMYATKRESSLVIYETELDVAKHGIGTDLRVAEYDKAEEYEEPELTYFMNDANSGFNREVKKENPTETSGLISRYQIDYEDAKDKLKSEEKAARYKWGFIKTLTLIVPCVIVIIFIVSIVFSSRYTNVKISSTGTTEEDKFVTDTLSKDITVEDSSTTDTVDAGLSSYSIDTSLTVEDGDTVNIDYVGIIDGMEFDGGSTNGLGTDLTIGSGSYIDTFEEQLIGTHPGDTVEVIVTFPDDFGNEYLNGKKAIFTVNVNGIYE